MCIRSQFIEWSIVGVPSSQAFGLSYYCTSICVRSCRNLRSDYVDSQPNKNIVALKFPTPQVQCTKLLGCKCVQCRVCFDSSGHWSVKRDSLKGCVVSTCEGLGSGNPTPFTSIMTTAQQSDLLPTCHTQVHYQSIKWHTNVTVSAEPWIGVGRVDMKAIPLNVEHELTRQRRWDKQETQEYM